MSYLDTEGKYEIKCLSTAAEMTALPPFSFDVFLYLQPHHVALQAGPAWQMFVLINTQTNQVDGIAHFFRDEAFVRTPWRAPFGGLQLHPQVPDKVVRVFLNYLHQQLLQTEVSQVQWLQCPNVYAPEVNRYLRTELPVFHYTLQYNQRNHHIPVTQASFTAGLHSSLKRRLNKCLEAGFTFQQESMEALPEAYALLKYCREEKGKPLSLSLEQLQTYFNLFPDRYLLFTVRREQELAAVGIAVLVNKSILNHLYPASPRRFNAYSPTVLLNAGIYEYCQKNSITILDLGVSAPVQESEEDYQGLFTFKERLGGKESWKPTYLLKR